MYRNTSTPADDNGCGWFHLSPPRDVRPGHSGRTEARWVVLGAGFTGLAAARQLALKFPQDEIVVIEGQQVGFGASGRNSGFAIDLPHDIGAHDYIGDPATARMNLKLNHFAQSMIRTLVEQYGIDCQIRADGKYQAAVEEKGLAVLQAYRSGLDKLGQAYEMIEARDLPEHLGTSFYRQALYTPGTLLLQPAALAMGLANNLPANVSLYENTVITHLEQGDKITLRHANGEFIAHELLLCNNAFASHFGFLPGRLLPIFTYASMTRPLSVEEQARLGGKETWGIIPADPFGSTLRRTPDQRLLVRNSFSFNASGQAQQRYLERAARQHRTSFDRRFPMLPDMPFDYTWGGSMCLSRNHSSYFGSLAPRVHGALCCNGLGITRGTATGTLLANWLAGEKDELTDFLLASPGPNRNPPEPLLSLGVNLNLNWGQRRAGLEA
ncbi:oxidoreductase [Pseudomonas silesiensis]|jgi:glycine/D-amino acid oxidase-like deaminating enzyme|uniref:Oxidoreductase n=1 Tax=Pseudomonas silesiensis TaxID=1853130 RepID=A0A191YRG7_9PSED|nr:FAD-binding oxidoreductase [Pseudomonas silesiensis]ANJ55467.1 oxidoreductase [Pseudomonas silesiensis]